jgi:chromosomal replication initiator protein
MPGTYFGPGSTSDSWSDDADARRAWEHALARLQLQTTPAQFEIYLRDTLGVSYDAGASVLRVAAGNPFHVPWLEGRLSPAVHTVVAEVLGGPVRVEFVDPRPSAEPARRPDRPRPAQPRSRDSRAVRAAAQAAQSEQSALPAPSDGGDRPHAPKHVLGSPLNPRYTFQTFVVGKSNQLAHAASMAVVDDPGRSYNPLFLYGGVGLGKTHLLHAIGHSVAAKGLPVVYVSSETFTNELIESIRQHRTDDFRAKYRRARLLLIDDVQFISGKERTEEEFFHTFNAVHEAGGQIVLSSDRPPRAMTILEDRLRSRFEWGLIADIQAPDYETRIAILRSKVAGSLIGMVPSDVLDFIAQKVQSNIRELEGSLNRLLAFARHEQQPVTVDMAARALKDLVAPGPVSAGATSGAILAAVGRYFGVKLEDLKGKARHKQIVVPRQIAMYLLYEDARLSTPEVGRLLNRDHTTVLHGVKLVAGDIARDGPCRGAVRGVREVLKVAQVPVPTFQPA